MNLPFNTRMQAYYQKHAKSHNALLFLAGIILAVLYASPPITGGLFFDEIMTMCAETLILLALFAYVAFIKPIIPFTMRHTSIPEALIACILTVVASTRVSLSFFNTFFAQILQGGQKPSLVWEVYSRLSLPPMFIRISIYAFTIFGALMASYGLFFLLLAAVRLMRETIAYTVRHPERDALTSTPSVSKRCLIGAGLALITVVLCFFTLNKGQDWGADYSLYMRYAIQIAQGGTEQMRVPWGFPLMLAPIYNILGYDTLTYSDFIYYKIPGVICMTLLTFVSFLYFSKRFSLKWSFVLTAFIGFNLSFISFTNNVLTNLPFLLFCMLVIICVQQMFESEKPIRQLSFAIFAGLSICVANLIRSDGILLLLALGCMHLVCLICFLFRKNKFIGGLTAYSPVRRIWIHTVPYIVYFAATKLAYSFIQAPVLASNIASNAVRLLSIPLLDGVKYNFSQLGMFLQSLLPFGSFPELVLWVMLPLILIGIVRCFRKDLFSVIYFFGMLLFFTLLALRQGIRYLLPLLPILILFLASGVQALVSATIERLGKRFEVARIIRIIACVCVAGLLISSVTAAVANMQLDRVFNVASFSDDAKDVYRYIQKNTEENANIIFYKASVITLNTDRASNTVLSREIELPTYLLITSEYTPEHQLLPDKYPTVEALEGAYDITLNLIYQNALFQFYSVEPNIH